MTLIATQLDRNGIVFASDSNLTQGDRVVRQAPKSFSIPHLHGGLSVAGAYKVGDQPMDSWMPDFIAEHNCHEDQSLVGFAQALGRALECQMTAEQKCMFNFMHIAGYAPDTTDWHPEFHFVRNVTAIKPSGEYEGSTQEFQISEDFWSRDYRKLPALRASLASSEALYERAFYTNGFPPGRITYVAIETMLRALLPALWANSVWSFRPPKTLSESALLIQTQMTIILTLLELSDLPHYVGGEVRTLVIPPPAALQASTC
jgi:hypothetical protein